MKKFFCMMMAIAMVVSMAACAAGGSQGEEATAPAGLQVGFGRTSIMPNGTIHLGGTDSANRRTDQVLDPVYITCIALKEGEQTILMYTMDLLNAYDSCIGPAKTMVSSSTGVPQENILMSATHTHSGVGIGGSWDGVDDYKILFNNAAVSAATAAIADMAPAEVYFGGVETEGLAFVRHYELDNGTFAGSSFGDFKSGEIIGHAEKADQYLGLVRITRNEKKDIILMSFPAHATFNGQATDLWLSADYPGFARQQVENNGNYLAAFFVGGAGNQVPSSKIPGEDKVDGDDYKTHGKLLGDYALEAIPTLTKLENTELKLLGQVYTGNAIKEGLEKLPNVGPVIQAGKEYGNVDTRTVAIAREHGFASYFEATSVKSRASYPATFSMNLNAMSIGELSFVFAPFEMFGTQSMRIRAESPYASTFVITCSGGAEGYLPDLKGFEIGTYEACVTKYERGTAEKVTDTFLEMLNALKNQ